MGLDSDKRILVVGVGLRMLPMARTARGSTSLPSAPAALLVGAPALPARPAAKPNSNPHAKTSGPPNADADGNAHAYSKSFHHRNLTGSDPKSASRDSRGRFT